MSIRKLVVAWGPVGAWMGVIFFLSSQPTLPSLPGRIVDTLTQKGGHVTEYAILAGLCWRALRETGQTARPAIWAFVLAVLYAISDEWHQTFVPGRNGQALDVLIDAAGALAGLVVLERRHWNRSGAGSARRPAPDQRVRTVGPRDP